MHFAIFTIAVVLPSATSEQVNWESKLLTDLLKNYDPRVRPVKIHGSPVDDAFGLTLTGVFESDLQQNVFSIQAWMRQKWKDEYLVWDPAQYGSVSLLKVDPVLPGHGPIIWTPDVTSFYGQVQIMDELPVKTIIYHDGRVMWFQQRMYKIQCVPDQQFMTCKMRFGSWIFDQSELNIQPDGNNTIDKSEFVAAKWNVTEATYEYQNFIYACCPTESYPSIYINLKLLKTN